MVCKVLYWVCIWLNNGVQFAKCLSSSSDVKSKLMIHSATLSPIKSLHIHLVPLNLPSTIPCQPSSKCLNINIMPLAIYEIISKSYYLRSPTALGGFFIMFQGNYPSRKHLRRISWVLVKWDEPGSFIGNMINRKLKCISLSLGVQRRHRH